MIKKNSVCSKIAHTEINIPTCAKIAHVDFFYSPYPYPLNQKSNIYTKVYLNIKDDSYKNRKYN